MNNPFTQKRIDHLESLTFNEISNLTHEDFTTDEIKYLIEETPLRDEDKRYCVYFFVKKMSIVDTAKAVPASVSTASRRRKQLHDALILTLINMFFHHRH